jgi:hypothetical protein
MPRHLQVLIDDWLARGNQPKRFPERMSGLDRRRDFYAMAHDFAMRGHAKRYGHSRSIETERLAAK